MSIARKLMGVTKIAAPAGGWDLSNVVYNNVSFSVSAQDTIPRDVFFKPDGTKMYVVGDAGNDINEYDLSTAWDVSTASFVHRFLVQSQTSNPRGVFFKPDGTKMYVASASPVNINEYDLSTAWDVSTASILQSISFLGVTSLFIRPDGQELYIIDVGEDRVEQYSLSTAWDISTSTFIQGFNVVAEDGETPDPTFGTNPNSVFFKPDGAKMYVGVFGKTYEYDLSTAWDVSTASYVQNFNFSSQESNMQGFFFRSDGLKMYMTGVSTDTVYEYDL